MIAVEYTAAGPALVVESNGRHRSVPLRTTELADMFDDTRKRVVIDLDDRQYADRIRVQL